MRFCSSLGIVVESTHSTEWSGTQLKWASPLFQGSLGGHGQERGETESASRHDSRALEITLGLNGEDDPDVLRRRANLAVLEHSLGTSQRAVELMRCVSASQERVHGPDHMGTVLAKSNLAALLFLIGREEEAAPVWREALDVLTEEFPPEHPILQTLCANLAVYELSLGNFGDYISKLGLDD